MNNTKWVRMINEKQKKLNAEIYPETDLWQKIDPELGEMRKTTFRQILNICLLHKPVFTACACFIAGITAILFFTYGYFNSNQELSPGFVKLQEFDDAEKEYKKAKQSLLALCQKTGMPEKEAEIMKNNLKQIDGAINKMRNIVYEYPDSTFNRKYLADLYRQETQFLNRMKSGVENIND